MGQCLPARAAVDCTRGGQGHTPNTATSKHVGDSFQNSFIQFCCFIFTFYFFVGCGAGVPRVEVGGQLHRCWFSPSNLSVSGIELGSSGLVADVLPTEPSHEPSYFILLFFSIGLFIYFTYMGVCL